MTLPPIDDDVRGRVDDFCRRLLSEEPIPGLSVALLDAEATRYEAGYGNRDLAGGRPATPETLYGIASCSKSVAALAVLQLADNDLLSLDDPVREHLPVDVDDAEDPIRIRHLLSHSSGLPSLGVSETLIARKLRRGNDGPALGDVEDFYAHVDGARDEVAAPPGEHFAYCNSGYTLVGQLVEETTGKPVAEYVQSHVFDPLGMERATYDDREFARDDDHMTQYLLEDGEPTAASLPVRELSHAAGGVLAPVDELADYVRLHLRGGALDGQRLVDADTLAEAHEGHVETPAGQYGFGWRRREVAGEPLVGHAGDILVSTAYLGFLPGADRGLAVAANTSPDFSLAQVGLGLAAILLGEEPADAVTFWRRRRRRESLVGEYAAYRGVKRAVVTEDGNALHLRLVGTLEDSERPLFPAEAVGPDGDDATSDDIGGASADVPEGDTEARYFAVGPNGEREPAEFRVADDGTTVLLYDRWRLERVSPLTPPEE